MTDERLSAQAPHNNGNEPKDKPDPWVRPIIITFMPESEIVTKTTIDKIKQAGKDALDQAKAS